MGRVVYSLNLDGWGFVFFSFEMYCHKTSDYNCKFEATNWFKSIATKKKNVLKPFIYSVKFYFWILFKIYFHMKIKDKIVCHLTFHFIDLQ